MTTHPAAHDGAKGSVMYFDGLWRGCAGATLPLPEPPMTASDLLTLVFGAVKDGERQTNPVYALPVCDELDALFASIAVAAALVDDHGPMHWMGGR